MDNFLFNADVPYDDYIIYDEPIFYDGERLHKKKSGSSNGRLHRDEEYYKKLSAPFISISVLSTLKSVNNNNIVVNTKEIKYAGKETPIEFGINNLKIRNIESNIDINSNLVNEQIPIVANFLTSNLQEPENKFIEESQQNNFSFIIECNNITVNNDINITANILNTDQNIIIRSEVLTDGRQQN